jgi:hypothetical protein
MVEVRYRQDHPSTPEARIAARLKPSCGGDYDAEATTGSGPTRCVTAIHYGGAERQYGGDNKGEGDIDNRPRGSNNPRGEI